MLDAASIVTEAHPLGSKLKQERNIVIDVKTADGGSSAIRAYEIDEFLLIGEGLSHAINEIREKAQA